MGEENLENQREHTTESHDGLTHSFAAAIVLISTSVATAAAVTEAVSAFTRR